VLGTLRRPAFKDTFAALVYYHDEIRLAEIAALAEFSSEAPGLIDGFIRIRKGLPEFIGKEFRAVQDMKKIACHDTSPEYREK
jgi:hypothetical protein